MRGKPKYDLESISRTVAVTASFKEVEIQGDSI
jgi:hypothetical protein